MKREKVAERICEIHGGRWDPCCTGPEMSYVTMEFGEDKRAAEKALAGLLRLGFQDVYVRDLSGREEDFIVFINIGKN